jgi:hypothetical protein
MTPYELNLCAEAYTEKEDKKSKEEITYLWLSEYYHRQKKLPPLKKVLQELFGSKGRKQMSDEAMLEMVKQLNAQFGGIEEKAVEK